MPSSTQKVAVIGLGAYGIVTVKNMLEVGFEVVGFEKNDYVGGLWKATSNSTQTSVLPSTIANISKQRNCYTDFPFPEEIPNHPTSAQMQDYLESYVKHFDLAPHFRLRSAVQAVRRIEKTEKWLIVVSTAENSTVEEAFDKVIITTGTFHTAIMPDIQGSHNFKGRLIHCQQYKDVNDFKDQTVMVVGLSNSGADTTVELAKVAKKVYISHRSGARILPRLVEGNKPADHLATRQLGNIAAFLLKLSPTLMNKLIEHEIEKAMRKAYPNIDPAWNLLPAPPPSHDTPIVNDHFMDVLAQGQATSLPGIKEITDAGAVVMTDGTTLDDIDAIVCCTGYRASYDILDSSINPTSGPTPEFDAAPYGSSVRKYARLYQGIFSAKYPASLAFIGPYLIISAFTGADVVSQAIAQVFTGAFPLPPRAKIDEWCDAHYNWSVEQAHIGRSPLGLINSSEVEDWLDEACGNKLNEKLGWGIEGWKFWWQERELWTLLMKGVNTGFAYRLFDGRRKAWAGAREAIYKANGKQYLEKI